MVRKTIMVNMNMNTQHMQNFDTKYTKSILASNMYLNLMISTICR